MSYILSNTDFHFGLIELIALIAMLAVITTVIIKLKKLKEASEELKTKYAGMNLDEAIGLDKDEKAETVAAEPTTKKE